MRISIDVPPEGIVEAFQRLDDYFSSVGFYVKRDKWTYHAGWHDLKIGTTVRALKYENGRLELEVSRPARIGCVHFGMGGENPDSDLFLFGIPASVGYSCEIKP